jgi:hypothetical protein
LLLRSFSGIFFIATWEQESEHGVVAMPTVLRDGPYTFVFFSSDRGEPAHVHVKRDQQIAKFWLEPISLSKNYGFQEHELNQLTRLVVKHHAKLLQAWHEYFSS